MPHKLCGMIIYDVGLILFKDWHSTRGNDQRFMDHGMRLPTNSQPLKTLSLRVFLKI